MTDFKMIPLKQISPDPNQPRKHYDELAMQELTESVKEKGVLQNILVRPSGKGYMLVCGERRYRAATAAGLPEIPARIQDLSDQEALELQIIENLQRKDVNAMEEGQAFRMLKEKMSIEEIGHRVGKGAAYVAQRLKLTDLTREWQDLLFADKLKLTLAFKIARLPESSQKEIYKEARVPKDWAKKKEWQMPSWVGVGNHEQELNQASFKTEDPDLYPEAGPCNTCQHNSHFNKLLFPDLQKKRICHNGVCFQIKSQKAYQQTIEKAMQDPGVIFITTKSYPDGDDKKKIKAAEELGARVLPSDMIENASEPEAPEPWEEYMEEQKTSDCDFDEWDELTEKDKKKKEKEWRDDYNDLVNDYQEELKEYQEAEASGLFKKAFVVAGYNHEGQIINVKIRAKKGITKENAAAGDNIDLIDIQSEMADIRQREERNKELDREKVYKRVITELMKEDDNSFLVNKDDLFPVERAALIYAIAESCFFVRDMIVEELKSNDRYGIGLYQDILKNQQSPKADTLLHSVFRHFISHKLIAATNLDYGKNGAPAAIYDVALEYFEKSMDIFAIEQSERSTKRQANVKKRLDALEAKKKELQAAAKPEAKKPVTKKSPAKKSAKKTK